MLLNTTVINCKKNGKTTNNNQRTIKISKKIKFKY